MLELAEVEVFGSQPMEEILGTNWSQPMAIIM